MLPNKKETPGIVALSCESLLPYILILVLLSNIVYLLSPVTSLFVSLYNPIWYWRNLFLSLIGKPCNHDNALVKSFRNAQIHKSSIVNLSFLIEFFLWIFWICCLQGEKKSPEAVLFTSHISECYRKAHRRWETWWNNHQASSVHSKVLCGFLLVWFILIKTACVFPSNTISPLSWC